MTSANSDGAFRQSGGASEQPPASEPAHPESEPTSGLPQLGSLTSLAQTARMKHINTAKGWLYVIGILTMVLSVVIFASAAQSVQTQIDKELRDLGPGVEVDHAKLAVLQGQAVASTRFGAGLGFLEGAVFVLLGAFVRRAPVAMTASGLILYIADYAIGTVLDPTYLVKGIVVRIFVIVCLVKALKAAIACERERRIAETVA